MCFRISQKYPCEMIADRRIRCYKVLSVDSQGRLTAPIFSFCVYFNRFSMRRKKEMRSKLDVEVSQNLYGPPRTIETGLHSFSTYSQAYGMNRTLTDKGRIYKAYIPKGATYWYNPTHNEYVSDRLVVTRRRLKHCPWPTLYLKKK